MAFLPQDTDWARVLAGIGAGLSSAGQPGGNLGTFSQGLMGGVQSYDAGLDRKRQAELDQARLDILQQQQEDARTANADAVKQRQLQAELLADLARNGPMQPGVAGAGPMQGGGVQTASGPMAGGQIDPRIFQAYPELGQKYLEQQMFPAADKPQTTDDIREYELAKSQGYTGSFFDYQNDLRKAGASSPRVDVHVPGQPMIGTIPQGFQVIQGPDGSYQMSPIPGGPAAIEEAEKGAKAEQAAASQQQSADIVTQDIGRALDIVNQSPKSTTGFFGNMLSGVAGTDANNVRKLLDTVEANTAFDKLQQMRAASPTGGALGSITERELSLLAATRGSLEQSQTKEQFEYNLKRLNNVVLDIVHGEGQGPERYDLGASSGAGDLKSKYGLE